MAPSCYSGWRSSTAAAFGKAPWPSLFLVCMAHPNSLPSHSNQWLQKSTHGRTCTATDHNPTSVMKKPYSLVVGLQHFVVVHDLTPEAKALTSIPENQQRFLEPFWLCCCFFRLFFPAAACYWRDWLAVGRLCAGLLDSSGGQRNHKSVVSSMNL